MDDIRDDGQATFPADGVRLDAVAEGRIPAAELTPEEANLAGMIAAVAGPAIGEELSGLSPALAAFARHHAAATASESVTIGASNRRRLGRRATAALAASALVVLASGTAAAAYTGSLPEPLQRLAHVALNAPAPPSSTPEPVDSVALGAPRPSGATVPSPRPTPTPSLIGPPTSSASSSAPTPTTRAHPTPDPTATSLPTPSAGSTGNSALGLCRAWMRIGSHANPNSAVVRSLIALAGSQSQITAYCAALGVVATPAPGSNGNKSGGGNGHGKGTGGSVPITSPKPTPTGHPTGHPTRHPRSTAPLTPANQATIGPTVPAPSHWRNNPQPHAGSS